MPTEVAIPAPKDMTSLWIVGFCCVSLLLLLGWVVKTLLATNSDNMTGVKNAMTANAVAMSDNTRAIANLTHVIEKSPPCRFNDVDADTLVRGARKTLEGSTR